MMRLLAVAAAIVALALSSRLDVPMVPVPMTLQTLAVLLVGLFYGPLRGGIAVAAWLALGALGAPVFAGGEGGTAHLLGPTGGYLVGFLVSPIFMGWMGGRGWNGARPLRAFVAMLAGHAICLGLGALWLSRSIGLADAIGGGVTPFLIGAVVKSAAGAVIAYLACRLTRPANASAATGGEQR